MRRLIALFLLVLLPLQAVWAAVEPYCLHESSQVDAHHLGHHEHEHQHHADASSDHPDGDAQDDSPASAMLDHDHHCCSAVSLPPAAMPLPGLPMPQTELVASPLAGYTSFDATRIERPNWTVLP